MRPGGKASVCSFLRTGWRGESIKRDSKSNAPILRYTISRGLPIIFDNNGGYRCLHTVNASDLRPINRNIGTQLPSCCISCVVNQASCGYEQQERNPYHPPIWRRVAIVLLSHLLWFLIAFRGWGYLDNGQWLLVSCCGAVVGLLPLVACFFGDSACVGGAGV